MSTDNSINPYFHFNKQNRRTSSLTPKEKVAKCQREGVQAKTMADLITPRQCVAIRAIARLAQIDAEAESIKLFKVSYEKLSRGAASALIEWLKEVR